MSSCPTCGKDLSEGCSCNIAATDNSNSWIIGSVAMLLCCNQVLGVIMLGFSIMMKSDYDSKNFNAYLIKEKTMKILMWIGIITTAILFVGVFLFYGAAMFSIFAFA